MTKLLFPRLPKPQALDLAAQRAAYPIQHLVELANQLDHPSLYYAPTGGVRVDKEQLLYLQSMVRETASHYGYPSVLRVRDVSAFDKACAKLLYEQMTIHPVEASALGIWMYLTVILLPDVVRWRFPDSSDVTSIERFIGSGRGLRRNTFGRMWWRAHLFYLPTNEDDPYLLLGVLTEDDQIQISERPSLSGNPRLAREVAVSYLTAQRLIQRKGLVVDRRILLRDALKRLSRLIPMTLLDMLNEDELQQVIDSIFHQTIDSVAAY